jgi:hypothetical protein
MALAVFSPMVGILNKPHVPFSSVNLLLYSA